MNACLVHFSYMSISDQGDGLSLIVYYMSYYRHVSHNIITIETDEFILYICLSRDLKVINVFM